ncbi:MAG: hypothetical protein HKM06_00075 [Spirochaetales bacterium]|nr:hypothetical protein [Spirochaetales bacterium]
MALLSAVFYHLSVFGLFFLVPLQVVYVRRGRLPFVLAIFLSAVLIVLGLGLELLLAKQDWTVFDTLSAMLAGILLGGWLLAVLLEKTGWRFLVRLSLAVAAAGLVVFTLGGWALQDVSFQSQLQTDLMPIWKKLVSTVGMETVNGLFPAQWVRDPAAMLKGMEDAVLSTVLVSFFVVWLVTWRLVRSVPGSRFLLKNFRLPSSASLILLGVWALFLGDSLLAQGGHDFLGFAMYIVSNLAWITLVVHALAGWGIVQSLLERWRLPLVLRGLVLGLLAFFCFWVGSTAEVVTLVGLTVLAVLELWVNFRNYHSGSEEVL